MSYEPRTIIEEDGGAVIPRSRREVQHAPSVQYTSSVVLNIRQLQTELSAQHQHEKSALIELNQRFHSFVDRVHQLQLENSKYNAAISELRRHHSGYSSIDVQTNDNYLAITSNLSLMRGGIIDYHWDTELFLVQVAIYKQLIDIEQQHIRGPSSLEDEVKQSASILVSIRSTYGDLHRKVEVLYAECDDLFKHYLTLTHDWCIAKKQRAKWELTLQTLKNSIVFYKNLKSYSLR
jgi:hypothetical protein